MTNSRRQRIITELISIFKKNTKLYGHKTDLGSNVFEWKTTDFQEVDLPGMELRDTEELIEIILENEELIANLDNIEIQRLELDGVVKRFYIHEGAYFMVKRVKNMSLNQESLPCEIYGNCIEINDRDTTKTRISSS